MEIVNSNSATLCNFEVMSHLQKIKDTKMKNKGQLATITYETLKYLESSPCKEQQSDNISNYLRDLNKFNLNKGEKLMLVNFPPTTAVEIQLMIEESEERLTEEQVQEIIVLTEKYFPHVIKEPKEEEEAVD